LQEKQHLITMVMATDERSFSVFSNGWWRVDFERRQTVRRLLPRRPVRSCLTRRQGMRSFLARRQCCEKATHELAVLREGHFRYVART